MKLRSVACLIGALAISCAPFVLAVSGGGFPSQPTFTNVTINGTGGNVPTIVTGSFTATISGGCTTTPSLGTVTYRIVDKRATLVLPTNSTCTSNSTFLQVGGLPAALQGGTTCSATTCSFTTNTLEDNGVTSLSGCYSISGSTISFGLQVVSGTNIRCPGGGFTASGTKGFSGVAANTWSIVIPLN